MLHDTLEVKTQFQKKKKKVTKATLTTAKNLLGMLVVQAWKRQGWNANSRRAQQEKMSAKFQQGLSGHSTHKPALRIKCLGCKKQASRRCLCSQWQFLCCRSLREARKQTQQMRWESLSGWKWCLVVCTRHRTTSRRLQTNMGYWWCFQPLWASKSVLMHVATWNKKRAWVRKKSTRSPM